jgi:hypothetical protein
MSRNDHTSNRRRAAVGVGVATGAAFAAGFIGLGTAATAGAAGEADAFNAAATAAGLDVAPALAATPPGTLDPAPPVDVDPGEAPYDTDGYQILFGAEGNDNLDGNPLQGEDNANLGSQLFADDKGTFTSFDESAAAFEANNEHPLEGIINFLDPNAYVDQTTDGIGGVDGSADSAYLVPNDFFGYLGTLGDYYLSPTGLPFLLSPVTEFLFGPDAFTF